MADEALTAGSVARRLGVAVTTLRTWHQRYGLGPSHHVPGRHRRYTPEDLDRLETMRKFTARGVPPAEAAAWARRVTFPVKPAASASREEQLDGAWLVDRPIEAMDAHAGATDYAPTTAAPTTAAPTTAAPTTAAPTTAAPTTAAPTNGRAEAADPPTSCDSPATRGDVGASALPLRPNRRDGGGNAIPLGRVDPAARGLARAAMRLDASTIRDIVQGAVADRGVVVAWERVILPVLVGIGERYEATQRLVEVEHLASRCVTEILGSVARPPARRPTRVLLACADGEQHSLPMEALAAALAEAGVPNRLLGAQVPASALADAIARTGPTVVVVWSQQPRTADATQLVRLLTGPRRPLVVAAAGPGWAYVELPVEIVVLTGLAQAVRVVRAVVGVTQQAG